MRIVASLAALLVATTGASAAEIKALITTAMDAAVVVLVPSFERATGNKVIVSYDPSGGLARRLRGGEFADMILVASNELEALKAEGKVKDRIDISRTGIGLAVKKGAPHPDVSTAEALKRTLLAAKSIVHTQPGNGGATSMFIPSLFAKLGIAEQLAPKIKFAAGGPNGRVSALIASGEAEIGLQQVSELMGNPDVEVIGLLPDALQQITINSAGITAIAKEPDLAHALIAHMTTSEAKALYRQKGLGL